MEKQEVLEAAQIADQLEILLLPDAPQGTEIAKVDVVIRLRRR